VLLQQLLETISKVLRKQGVAGGSVFRGVEGGVDVKGVVAGGVVGSLV
jgi:hypothetical protein